MMITAYSITGTTADGGTTHWPDAAHHYIGVCAASTAQFPFGTILEIAGVGRYMVEDTGSAVGWGHLDISMPNDYYGARQFGVQYHEVTIIRLGWTELIKTTKKVTHRLARRHASDAISIPRSPAPPKP